MKDIHVLSWGGGTQSTALMLKMLDDKVFDEHGVLIKPDYIIFADTGDENQLVMNQVYKVIKYVEDKYGIEVIITKRTKEYHKTDEMIQLIKDGALEGKQYKSTKYADLYQEQLLFYKGVINQANLVPSWVINKKGELGKMMGRNCTVEYKIVQIVREIRIRETVKAFSKLKHKIHMYIGFSIDELSRVKTSPQSYIVNKFPLVDLNMTKIDCIEYVEKVLGFTPKSSVCNICYANDFYRVYDLYKNDKEAWDKITVLDEAMHNKSADNKIRGDVYLFQWQAKMRKRFNEIDMEAEYTKRKKYTQLSIYDMEQEMACMGGCFL